MLIFFFFCYGNKRRSTKIQSSLNALDLGLNNLVLYYIPKCNQLKTQTFLELLGHDAYLENMILLLWVGELFCSRLKLLFCLYYGDIPKPETPHCLKVVKKFVVVGGWMLKPILVFSLDHAEQNGYAIF
jgi:hypothetical protein